MTTQIRSIEWPGQLGQKYRYGIHPIGTNFEKAAGNYIFANEPIPNRWDPVYIGETADLSERFDNHHAMPCIRQNVATHIHVHTNQQGDDARRAEEDDIIAAYNPVCNR